MDDIEELQVAILNLNGRTSTYAESVPVHEEFQGETVWEGEGEVFDIEGHPKATRAYALGHATGEEDQARRYDTVLELPPVDSPQTAVKAAIMSEIKNARKKS